MSEIKLSIIIPVYNSEKYIKYCLESILSQTFKDIEIICVDDGSKDKSAEIIKEYTKHHSNIKYIYQENSGPGKARKVGIEHATGDYIGSVDSDDTVSDDYFEKLYNVALKTNAEIVFKDRFNREYLKEGAILTTPQEKIKLFDNGALWNKIYKKDFLKQNFKYWENTNFIEDYYTWIFLSVAAKKIAIQKTGGEYYYRQDNEDSLTHKLNNEKHFSYIETFLSIIDEIKKLKIKDEDKKVYINGVMSSWKKVSTHLFYHLEYPQKRKYIKFMRKVNKEISQSIPKLNMNWKIVKNDNSKTLYIFGVKLFTFKHKSKYRKIYEKRFKGLTEAEQRYILEQQFIRNTGYPLNLDNPQTFNEKIQWLKLYDHNPLMTICADKVAVRDYIKEKIGEEYLVPALGIYDKPEDIDFDKLPNRFVLKVNWGSGQNIIVKDKSTLDIEAAKTQLAEWMKPENNHYYDNLEWCYKDIKPKILCEQFLESIDDLRDYKFHCFNGNIESILVCGDRNTDVYFDFYDNRLNLLPFTRGGRNSFKSLQIPKNINEMNKIAKLLAQNFNFVRVDFFEDKNNKMYLGELTFYPGNGTISFEPREWDYKFGELIELPITEK